METLEVSEEVAEEIALSWVKSFDDIAYADDVSFRIISRR